MNWDELAMITTVEELGEVATEAQELLTKALSAQKRVTKMMRFGPTEVQPLQSKDNSTRLRDEIIDVLICVRFLQSRGLITPISTLDVDLAYLDRKAKIDAMRRRSIDHGRLTGEE